MRQSTCFWKDFFSGSRYPRAGSHWKSGHYSYEQYGGVYGGLAVDGLFAVKFCIFCAPSVRTDVERHFSEPTMAKSSLPSRAPAQFILSVC